MTPSDETGPLMLRELPRTPQCEGMSDGRPTRECDVSATRRSGLKVTRAADYGVRAVVHLASLPDGTVVAQTELARAIQAPSVFAGKVLQQLAASGLVTSRRGKRGGFGLTARGRDGSMFDVLVAIEGPLALNDCLSPDTPCIRAPYCAAHLVWQQAQAQVIQVLRAARIELLAATARRLAASPPSVEG